MKNKRWIAPLIFLLFVAVCACSIILVPYISVVVPALPEDIESRLPSPKSGLTRIVIKRGEEKDSLFSKIRRPDLVIYSPLSSVHESSSLTLQWGVKESEADYFFSFDPLTMYYDALEELGDKTIAFLFEESDSESERIFNELSSSFPSLVKVVYSQRVSVVNKDEILSSLDNVWGVIVTDPENSGEAWRETKARVIMDSRFALSVLTIDRVISIAPDWDSILTSVFSGEEISPHFTLSVLKK